jgi:hypothetical protein
MSRILREEFQKKNGTELSLYLLCSFFVYSNFSDFHSKLVENQIGDSTLRIITYQINKFDVRYSEFIQLDKKKKDYD